MEDFNSLKLILNKTEEISKHNGQLSDFVAWMITNFSFTLKEQSVYQAKLIKKLTPEEQAKSAQEYIRGVFDKAKPKNTDIYKQKAIPSEGNSPEQLLNDSDVQGCPDAIAPPMSDEDKNLLSEVMKKLSKSEGEWLTKTLPSLEVQKKDLGYLINQLEKSKNHEAAKLLEARLIGLDNANIMTNIHNQLGKLSDNLSNPALDLPKDAPLAEAVVEEKFPTIPELVEGMVLINSKNWANEFKETANLIKAKLKTSLDSISDAESSASFHKSNKND